MSHPAGSRRSRAAVTVMTAGCATTVLGIGLLALLAPRSFAGMINFAPYNEHLLHDVGAFQVGIAVSLLAALRWSDALGVALLGFVVGDAIHTANHALDRHLGGHSSDLWLLGGLGLLATAALILQLRTNRAAPLSPQPPSLEKRSE